ncbi:MAG TPA: NADH-quinone oxidoreductase subunit J [Anaerolineae bacterium]|nr:NADH-quinone oxidoreductase subunit J [Anaerolineae bacterium]
MTGMDSLFLIFAVITLISAFLVVTTKNLFHAALWLIMTLFGVAAIYVLLNAFYLAVIQVIVYIGAIAILMIFAIMLTQRVMNPSGRIFNKNWIIAALLGAFMFIGLVIISMQTGASKTTLPQISGQLDTVSELGQALVSPNAYVIPFEVASVLLLAALIGAIFVSRKR